MQEGIYEMTTPGYGGPARASESGQQGAGGVSDPTFEHGSYADSIFGMKLPQGTGAPGSPGADGKAADPTNQPGELDEGFSGLGPQDVANTGAPGSAGVDSTGGGGSPITYTDPGSFLGGTYQSKTVRDEVSGPNDWTQAADGLYTGNGNLPGIKEAAPGLADTGAGEGHVMRGGRAVGG